MFEIIFLSVLALIWILFATIQDLKTKEVANWLNFSLIIFALGFRFFYSLFSQTSFSFLYQGLIGLVIFFILGNLFYYSKMFAGGDAKLFIALGVILPFSSDLILNLKFFVMFFFIFFLTGAIYGLIWSVVLVLKNRKKFKAQFSKLSQKNKKLIYSSRLIGLLFMIAGFYETLFLLIGILIFILPSFYIYAKSIDESCMVKRIKTKYLREGDWIYKDIKIGRKTIKAKWGGLTKKEIKYLQKKKRFVYIKQGIPFVPVFLISFIILLIAYFLGYSLF